MPITLKPAQPGHAPPRDAGLKFKLTRDLSGDLAAALRRAAEGGGAAVIPPAPVVYSLRWWNPSNDLWDIEADASIISPGGSTTGEYYLKAGRILNYVETLPVTWTVTYTTAGGTTHTYAQSIPAGAAVAITEGEVTRYAPCVFFSGPVIVVHLSWDTSGDVRPIWPGTLSVRAEGNGQTLSAITLTYAQGH